MEYTEQIPQTPATAPAPAPTGGDFTKVLLIFLGIGVVIGIVVMLMRKSAGTGTMFGMSANSGQNNQAQQQQQTSGQTYTNNNTYTPPSNPKAVAHLYIYSDKVLAVQKNLNKTCINAIGGKTIAEDGTLGNETIGAIGNINAKGKQIADEIRKTGFMTQEQIDWGLLSCGADTRGASSSSSSSSNVAIKDMNQAQLREYILANTNRIYASYLADWRTEGLREWANALKNKQDTFNCTKCLYALTYKTYRK